VPDPLLYKHNGATLPRPPFIPGTAFWITTSRGKHVGRRLTNSSAPHRHDLQRVVWQRSLQRSRLVLGPPHTDITLTGMAFGWMGSTIAFGAVVRKPYTS
jgi:hypothetical protein